MNLFLVAECCQRENNYNLANWYQYKFKTPNTISAKNSPSHIYCLSSELQTLKTQQCTLKSTGCLTDSPKILSQPTRLYISEPPPISPASPGVLCPLIIKGHTHQPFLSLSNTPKKRFTFQPLDLPHFLPFACKFTQSHSPAHLITSTQSLV